MGDSFVQKCEPQKNYTFSCIVYPQLKHGFY